MISKNVMRKYTEIILLFLVSFFISCNTEIKDYTEIARIPSIFPDYTNILIPPNIAPLNFKINEPGSKYVARIYISDNESIVVNSNDPNIKINNKAWHKLLDKGKGKRYQIEIFVKSDKGTWQKFKTIVNKIADKKIDSHLAYRLINTGYVQWNDLGIYQRNLENFDEKPILENKSIGYGCINCHSFANNNPEKMMIHIRKNHGGTIISKDNGKLQKVNTNTPYTLNAGAYPSWHPNGKHIAYSVNNIGQYFCTGETRIEVTDSYSDLIVYDVENNQVITSPKVSTKDRENLPIWSPDGKFIYFIKARPENPNNKIDVKYDLMRIGFDVNTNSWGNVDTLLLSRQIRKSISFPKISPDGKFLMFCASDNGYFTIHHPQTDLNILEIKSGKIKRLNINSPETDSYHSFSSTGNWFVFSSKRMDGLFTRPYFSYLYENGVASKPFVLPQEDPAFYESFIKNYNIPELITGEVPYSQIEIRDKILEDPIPAKIHESVDTTFLKRHLQAIRN